MKIYSAKYVLPISSRAIADGAVAVDRGRIVAVGPAGSVSAAVGGGAERVALGDAVILPGLVNSHTHLELSWTAATRVSCQRGSSHISPALDNAGGVGPPVLAHGDYAGWLRRLLELRDAGTPADAGDHVARALGAMAARGTVAVGDVTNDGSTAVRLAASPLHAVVFVELYGLRAEETERRLTEAVARLESIAAAPEVAAAGDRLRLALTPHAPHTTGPPLLRALAGRAAAARGALSVHVAESRAEVELLADGEGPLAELFRERAFLPPGWTAPGRSPVEQLRRAGALSARTLAVHCVHLEQVDRSTLQASGATVVTCPRSNAALGVGVAPVPELLREGVPVALGTDSLASAPDLDLFAEMRAAREIHPDLPAAAVVRMATLNGARALGLSDRLGSIEPGKLAELIVVPLDGAVDRPFDAICGMPEQVWRLEQAPVGTPP
ncbi:MAG TPA: amidohydrolase family protein [Candidatus Polarisedimenticolaceae bacterium]|nr:amidohydrolase family protein [Candidatus Polarisedimenticolaceae bacterium]